MSLPPAWVLVESSSARAQRSIATGAVSFVMALGHLASSFFAVVRLMPAFLAASASRTETVVKPVMGAMTVTVTVSVSTLPKDKKEVTFSPGAVSRNKPLPLMTFHTRPELRSRSLVQQALVPGRKIDGTPR